jgi:tetratricopeptide (TPR) repeat protein
LNRQEAQCLFANAIDLQDEGKKDEALTLLRRVVDADPDHAEALNAIGWHLIEYNSFRLARSCFIKASRLAPTQKNWVDVANCLRLEERFVEAARIFDGITAQRPLDGYAKHKLGLLRHDQGDFDAAIALFSEAELEMDDAWARWDRALSLLAKGDFELGFAEYDARFHVWLPHFLEMPLPIWRGEDLGDNGLWVVSEQGLGDTIMFSRFVPKISARRIVFDVQSELVALLAENLKQCGNIEVRSMNDNPPEGCSMFCPLLSVPDRIRAVWPPEGKPYLTTGEPTTFIGPSKQVKVGICWSTNRLQHRQQIRKLDVSAMLELADIPGVALYSLQMGDARAQLQRSAADVLIQDLSPWLKSMRDTAAIMLYELDLVISVDTAVAHLAGALGVPCWVLAPNVAYWGWGREGEKSPWYDSVRIFREPRPGAWPLAMQNVATALRERVC